MRRSQVLLSCGALLALVAGCTKTVSGSGTAVINGEWVANTIESSDEAKQLGIDDVSCPKDEPLDVGRRFECTAGEAVIEVRITSGKLDFSWSLKASG